MSQMQQAQVLDGKYEILRLLGEGGMGAVYEARHRGTGRRVAVEVIIGEALQKDAGIVARFQREARAAGAIDSQHVAQVLDTGVDGASGNPYMVMELLSGQDLQQLIQANGAVHPELAMRIAAQACFGLQRAHDAGVVHRDIKSANLYLARKDGGEVVVKLLDFGIAKVRADQLSQAENHGLTRTGSMLGSPLYMSPEQAKGSKSIDHRSDIWSLGVAVYESLTGVTPHSHCDTLGGLIIAICSEPPRPVQDAASWVPPEVAAIVHRALALDVNARFQSAAEMAEAIRVLLPNGAMITEPMLQPVPPQMRSFVAQRYTTMAVESPTSLPASRDGVASASTLGSGTGAGVAKPPEVPAARSAAIWAIPAGIAVVAALSVGGFFALRSNSQPATADTNASRSAPATAPTTPAAGVASQRPSEPEERTVHLAILPRDARVEVDGRVVVNRICAANEPACEPGVTFSGALGSLHRIKVMAPEGKRETPGEFVIAESGAVPSKFELGVAPPPAPTGATNTTAATTSTTATGPATHTQPTATAIATKPPPPPPTTTINHTF